MDIDALLAAHDEQLRSEAEVRDADEVARLGPLWLGRYGERGFVTYASLEEAEGGTVADLIDAAIAHFAADPRVGSFEWKTRGHDAPADLPERLMAAGFRPEDPEAVMIGEAAAFVGATAPDGFAVRRAGDSGSLADDVRRAGVLHRTVFGPDSPDMDDELLRRLSTDAAHQELWLVERDGEAVSAGIVSVVPRTRFAGLWGGATLPEHRHSGLYRALTGARARTALSKGADLLYAECTPFSRPILERAGFVRVTTTTPYVWHRLDDSP